VIALLPSEASSLCTEHFYQDPVTAFKTSLKSYRSIWLPLRQRITYKIAVVTSGPQTVKICLLQSTSRIPTVVLILKVICPVAPDCITSF
jgi:hypothetical protein